MQLKLSLFVKFITSLSFLLILSTPVLAQNFSAKVLNRKNNTPLEFINIGIVGKGIGTVSDQNGNFSLTLDSRFDSDTLVFSCIGFTSFAVKVYDFKKMPMPTQIYLDEKIFQLNEVVIKPKNFVQKRFGVSTKSKTLLLGIVNNELGYEGGALMDIKKSATLETVHINVASCTFDSVFFRLNIYKVIGKMKFENILQQPIYFNLKKTDINEAITIDLKSKNINVDGPCLITIENIKNLGSGSLMIPCALFHKTYFRKTSQDKWTTAPVGISLSVDALVEK